MVKSNTGITFENDQKWVKNASFNAALGQIRMNFGKKMFDPEFRVKSY